MAVNSQVIVTCSLKKVLPPNPPKGVHIQHHPANGLDLLQNKKAGIADANRGNYDSPIARARERCLRQVRTGLRFK